MRNDVSEFVLVLVSEEICRLVAEAVISGTVISANAAAAEVQRVYPGCGLGRRDLAEHVKTAAASAGVAIASDRVPGGRYAATEGRRA